MSNMRIIFRLLPYIQICSGLILLILEIRDFITLPTVKLAEELYGQLVSLIKYKDTTYWLIPLWMLLLYSGISYWINKKLYKIPTILFIALFPFIYIFRIQYYFY